MSEPKEITDTLNAIEAAERGPDHPRTLARQAVAKWRAGSAIDSRYDFTSASPELKQVVYNVIVRFSRRRLWSRLLR